MNELEGGMLAFLHPIRDDDDDSNDDDDGYEGGGALGRRSTKVFLTNLQCGTSSPFLPDSFL